MGIFELATMLGKALKEDERLQKLEAAKKAYEECGELQKKLVEYEVQQKALQRKMLKQKLNPKTMKPM